MVSLYDSKDSSLREMFEVRKSIETNRKSIDY